MKNEKFLKLKYWREYLNLSQEDMGVLLGYSNVNYCGKEKGRTRFSLDECFTIRNALNKMLKKEGIPAMTIDEIFEREHMK
ncbi:helix-turn-helix transcriptional regulator [[Clostridium] fimetarium]|uniref:DNA-binding transcriptional regulator, XRE-family HTH domain n=1 Tax=[Clostridium] fimetarium TaxID=99656 RepID=A0A1I0LZK4_9FIRM|nr:helix-turn-helix transcriptional regulator [[Clostridium] fimetarium]SEV81494.1 DNA-binding transcriptional regulator, XRE-family HTH domain [[Clostridium] fimetarium]